MSSSSGSKLPFRIYVKDALSETPEGVEILSVPSRFLANVLDSCEASSTELDILRDHHEDALIIPFRDAARKRSADAFADAIARGVRYLCESKHLDRRSAISFCNELAAGIADFVGVKLNIPGATVVSTPVHFDGNVTVSFVPQNNNTAEPTPPPRVQPPNVPKQTTVARQAPAPAKETARKLGWSIAAGIIFGVMALAAIFWWSTSQTQSQTPQEAEMGTVNTPVSEPTVFTISFETNGGTPIDSVEVEEGERCFAPANPERDGYLFLGWYRDNNFKKEASFPYTPKRDAVIYAKWEKISVLKDAVAYRRGDGHTYALFEPDANWQESESFCETLGGHLASVTSRYEQSIIEDLITEGSKNGYWLGGLLVAPEEWQWVTGEALYFENWSEGTPDNWIVEGENKDASPEDRSNVAIAENAIMIYRIDNPLAPQKAGEWNDLASNGDCNGEEFFGVQNIGLVCEWDEIVE